LPDEVNRKILVSTRAFGREAQSFDFGDELAAFVRMYPQWVGSDGLPLSWRHFVLGLRAGQRYEAKEMLKIYEPSLMAQTDKVSRVQWEDLVRTQAGQR
jgi:hypothetical protein